MSSAKNIHHEDALDESDKRLSTLDDAKSSYELQIDDPEKLDKEIDLAFHLRHEARQWRVKAAQLLAEIVKGEQSNKQTSQGSDFGGSSNKSNSPANVHQVDGIEAQESVFGWVLSGRWIVLSRENFVVSQMLS
ncbi:hypothetical protein SK128_024768 [Halocaridina rubra]|uniref:Uncharacterized protein n=1 Tax=Halocaridina rubra TaxID=373956 RepID=A0AAN8WBV0_HALRR